MTKAKPEFRVDPERFPDLIEPPSHRLDPYRNSLFIARPLLRSEVIIELLLSEFTREKVVHFGGVAVAPLMYRHAISNEEDQLGVCRSLQRRLLKRDADPLAVLLRPATAKTQNGGATHSVVIPFNVTQKDAQDTLRLEVSRLHTLVVERVGEKNAGVRMSPMLRIYETLDLSEANEVAAAVAEVQQDSGILGEPIIAETPKKY